MKFETKAIHKGYEKPSQNGETVVPIFNLPHLLMMRHKTLNLFLKVKIWICIFSNF